MFRNFKTILISLILICSGLFIFAGCGSSSSGMSSEDIKELISEDIAGVDTEISSIEADAAHASGEEAATLASDAYYLDHRLDDILGTFDRDIEDGYITEDERSDYEKEIDEIKQRISTAIADLTAKAGDKASTINPDSKALALTSKEDLDTLISDDDRLLTGFEAGIGTASSSTKETFRTLIEQRLDGVSSALDDLDRLEADGVITADEKTDYERSLKDLRKRFDDLDYQLGG